ncbi:hypothetical protein DRP77_13570 [Candidatus Poribacteria bacterium]|nr:MAG: hypothetical protein DRP77_13570 [Candidatus Poribacteria bacterium]
MDLRSLLRSEPLETMISRRVPVESIDDAARYIIEKIWEGRAHPVIHELASVILTRRTPDGRWVVPPKDWEAEVRAIFKFVQNAIRYTRDTYGMDTYRRAIRTLQLNMGDCDDQVILLGSLLQAVGYPIALKIVDTTDTPPGFNHIYLLVGLPPMNPRKWVPLDPTMPYDVGWEVPRYKVRDEVIYMV